MPSPTNIKTVIIQEKNTMDENPAKLTMTEFGLAASIESTETDAEKKLPLVFPSQLEI